MISIIAAVGKNFELGKNNDLIWYLPNDLKFFKETTLNKTILMGYNTFVSLKRLLPNRNHIVISNNDIILPKEVLKFNNIEDALKYIKDKDVFIIGGASIYEQFINYANRLYLTHIDASRPADVFFPSFDESNYNISIIGKNEDNNIKYKHVLYERKNNENNCN